jgi:hypothetical protein
MPPLFKLLPMKKLLLLSALFLITAAQAQFSVTKHDGTPIADNQVLTFSSLNYADAILEFYVHNNSNAPISMQIECVDITNGSGAGMELCFGNVCLSSVSEGHSYPNIPVTIMPGETNSQFDHFLNSNPGDGQNPIEYLFRFYMVNSEGDEIGSSTSFIYRYAPQLGLPGFGSSEAGKMGILVKSASNNLEIQSMQNADMAIYDMNGKLVANQKLTVGVSAIDTAHMAAGVYILNFKNEEGKTASEKFVKR